MLERRTALEEGGEGFLAAKVVVESVRSAMSAA